MLEWYLGEVVSMRSLDYLPNVPTSGPLIRRQWVESLRDAGGEGLILGGGEEVAAVDTAVSLRTFFR